MDSIKTTIELNVCNFIVPNCVVVTSDNKYDDKLDVKTLPLNKLDIATLSKLCDNFREEVFQKAQKHDTINK